MSPREAYTELTQRVRNIALLSSAGSILGWDERTYMPRGGSNLRADQLSLLSGMVHEQFTSPRIGELLDILEASDLVKNPESIEAVNVRELRHSYVKH